MDISRLVRVGPIFDATLINGTGSATSSAIDLEFARLEAMQFQASSVSSTAKVKLEYAVSPDNITYSSFDSFTDLISDNTVDFASPLSPEGMNAVAMPNPLSRYVKFKVTGISGNPTDTIVTAYLILREGD